MRWPKRTLEERFWSHVDLTASGCWPWTASIAGSGYGQFTGYHRSRRAHVVAFELTFGEVPNGLVVHHTCENNLCCNPFHLTTMTDSEHKRLHSLRRWSLKIFRNDEAWYQSMLDRTDARRAKGIARVTDGKSVTNKNVLDIRRLMQMSMEEK